MAVSGSLLLFPDRVSGQYTVWLLLALALALAAYQHLSPDPITCLTPAHFTSQDVRYAHEVCWNADTYHYFTTDPSFDPFEDKHTNMRLYQRLPVIILALGLLMFVPVCVWLVLQRHPGIPLMSVVSMARHCLSAKDSPTYQRLCNILARRFGQHLLDIRSNHSCAKFITIFNTYLSISYAITRLLHVVVSVVAVVFVRSLLASRDPLNHFFLHLTNGTNEAAVDNITDPFVSSILCSYDIKRLGSVYKYQVQCLQDHSLTINVLSLLAVWLSLILALNVASFVQYLVSTVLVPCHGGGVRAALISMGVTDTHKQFASLVSWDGVLMARFVSDAASAAVATEMLAGAYYLSTQSQNDAPQETTGARGQYMPLTAMPSQPQPQNVPSMPSQPQPQNVHCMPAAHVPPSFEHPPQNVYPDLKQ